MPEEIEIVPEFGEVREEEQLDWRKLAGYLREKLPGADTPMEVKQFRGGHSNLTYLLRFGSQEWVMRRPPFGPLPVGGHDMAREFRVLSRLWRVFKPAPKAIIFCEDPSIVGAPFFVMERRNGIVIKNRQPLPAELPADPDSLRRLSEGFIDAAADLHAVDYEAIGLSALGKPHGFLQRQISGWMARWEQAKTREVPLMEKLGAWFLEHTPPPQAPSIIHNDFYLHNIMIDYKDPGHVVGVFDWEMSTLGDPLVDVGIALNYWRDKTDSGELLATAQGEIHTLRPGFLTRDELIQRYAKRTGRDMSNIAFYWAWAHWKNATVVEQIYVRYVRGQTSDPRFAMMGSHAPALAIAAAKVAAGIGFKE
ncbi:MAG TPA: phosphotransferase family protein [Candidatus Binataceae bacterium]